MPEKLKKVFEKEYEAKGFSKKRADSIFYGHEANLKKHHLLNKQDLKGGHK